MFSRIMVPIDLSHADRMGSALRIAADLATKYGANVTYVAVTAEAPTSVAHNPEEFETRIHEFAAAQASEHGIGTDGRSFSSTDPSADMNGRLIEAVEKTGADLVVMATHVPGLAVHLWSGHGAHVATHARVSVFLVR